MHADQRKESGYPRAGRKKALSLLKNQPERKVVEEVESDTDEGVDKYGKVDLYVHPNITKLTLSSRDFFYFKDIANNRATTRRYCDSLAFSFPNLERLTVLAYIDDEAYRQEASARFESYIFRSFQNWNRNDKSSHLLLSVDLHELDDPERESDKNYKRERNLVLGSESSSPSSAKD